MGTLGRRDFLKLGCAAAAAFPALQALQAFADDRAAGPFEADSRFWIPLQDKGTQCFICPLHCRLKPGETCFCRTRSNLDGRLITKAYNNPCVLTIDPVEKMPLSHVLPGTSTLSLAVGGCNLRCLYCQNWQQSQAKPETLDTFDLPREKAVDGAARRNCPTIAYTYTEPVAFYEYMRDVAEFAKSKGIRNVCASAMFIEKEPLRAVTKHFDAFSVSLKAFDEKFYDKVLGIRLQPVLDAIVELKAQKVWTEVVTLVIPTYNDDFARIREQAKWHRRNLGEDTPLHFGRFTPEYRLKDLPRTPAETLERCRDIAREEGLKHVYIFNLSPHEGNHTYCPGCGAVAIERLGFRIVENAMKGSACGKCGAAIPGVWT